MSGTERDPVGSGFDAEPADAHVVSVHTPDEVVLVVDFGAQYAQLIARRVREARVYSEIVPHTITAQEIAGRAPAAIILSGGPKSVHVEGAPDLDPGIYDLGIPILGICYGSQLIAQQLGGTVARGGSGEYGRTVMHITQEAAGGSASPDSSAAPATAGGLLDGLPSNQTVWMSHFDAITEAPEGFRATASSDGAPVAVLEDPQRRIWGVQFHPEVHHTPHGQDVIERFLHDLAGCSAEWTMANFVDDAVADIRAQVGAGRAICGLSGGVDSAVAAALVHRAIGAQLTCVFVDTGLMRKDEGEQVVETFRRHQGIELIHERAADRFFERLAGITDPEEKRKAIGELFIRVFEEEASKIEGADFLVQGTLYSDVIESGGSDHAATIKSHHNVGGLPEDIEFQLVEPLRMLFKDEVRAVGTELELPDRMVWRQPFPGPGLGIRIVGGEVNKERLDILRQADHILHEEVGGANMYRDLWQFFCVLPVIRSVGVQGDGRTYAYPVVIRAVTSKDAMTADWARIPYDVLEKVSNRIINEVSGVNRVAYDITSKPPGTIEWE